MTAPRKRQRKGKQSETANSEWYSIRRILDERRRANRVEYLVDWDDDPNTGETYTPTWAKSIDVTDAAKQEWEKQKIAYNIDDSDAVEISSQESQSLQSSQSESFTEPQQTTPNSRVRSLSFSSDTETGPATKRPRYSSSPSDESVPSFISAPTSTSASELPDPVESHEIVISIPKSPNFDTSEYLSVSGSQSTSQPLQSVSELEEQDRVLAFSSQISRQTVPDSQEYSGQSLSTAPHQQEAQPICASLLSSSCAESSDPPHRHKLPTARDGDTGGAEERIPESSIRSALHADTDIPSGQPEVEQSLIDITDLNTNKPHSNPIVNSIPASVENSSHSGETQSAVFLSQIEIQFPSSTSSAQKGPASSQSQSRTAKPSSAPFRASQDAQVPSSLDASLDKITDSNKTVQSANDFSSLHRDCPLSSNSVFNFHLEVDGSMERKGASDEPDSTAPAGTAPASSAPASDAAASDVPKNDVLKNDVTASDAPASSAPASSGPKQQSLRDRIRENFTLAPLPRYLTAAGRYDPPPPGLPEKFTPRPCVPLDFFDNLRRRLQLPVPDPSGSAGSAGSLNSTTTSSVLAPNVRTEVDSQMFVVPEHSNQVQHNNISPADILQSAPVIEAPSANPAILDPSGDFPGTVSVSSADVLPLGQGSPRPSSSLGTNDDPCLMQHTITLPFQASIRPQYDDALLTYKKELEAFSQAFSSDEYIEPESSLVAKIDSLLTALRNLCDYPQDIVGTALETIPPREQVKYACDANSKFSFVFELLQGIETDTRVLIIVQSVDLLRLLANVAISLDIDCVAKALKDLSVASQESACHVTLALPDEEFDIADFKVVIGFDYTFGSSPVAKALSTEGQAVRSPLVLTLVTTYSIEHIDQQISQELPSLERRNALLSGIANARKLISDPDRDYPEPHEIARTFCDYLKGDKDGIFWNPIELPEDVLDVYEHTQTATQLPSAMEGGRKRKLVSTNSSQRKRAYLTKEKVDESEEDAKRARTIPMKATAGNEEVPLPDDVDWLLRSVADAGRKLPGQNVKIQVALSVLQALAEKCAELERQVAASDVGTHYTEIIDQLQKRVEEYERTSSQTYKAYREAIIDRTKFETDKATAETALKSAQTTALKESLKLCTRIAELEATMKRLTSNDDGENPLAVSERRALEAENRSRELEKRLESARQDGDYARNAYQQASSAMAALEAEARELRETNEALRRRSSETVARVHEIQSRSMAGAYTKQIADLSAMVREREAELDRLRDELRQARSSRRDAAVTRASSVPRSPRTGLMSPRGVARSYPPPPVPASMSRGASPTGATEGSTMMGANPFSGNANGRWNHLQD